MIHLSPISRTRSVLEVGWVALPARVVGVAVLLGALVVAVRPLVPVPKAYLAIATGFFEVVGMLTRRDILNLLEIKTDLTV